jgi:RNA binding exosome subunit
MEKRRLHGKVYTRKGLKRPISYVEISLFAHATEDPKKALKAARNIFPEQYISDVSFTRENLWGHHKNPIILFRTLIKRGRIINAFMENLFEELEATERESLSLDFKRCMDGEKTLYLRLDKQKAFLGEIELGHSDPIHVKINLTSNPKSFKEIVDSTNLIQ